MQQFDIPSDRTTKIRVKSSGQVLDAIPAVARAMLSGGTADLVKESGEIVETSPAAPESAALEPAAEKAVAPAHHPPKRKKGKK